MRFVLNPLTGLLDRIDQLNIGEFVQGGTVGSVLFIDANGLVGESNPGLTYDATSGSEQLLITGNDGPTADLVVRAVTGNWLDVGTSAGQGLFVGKVLIGSKNPEFMIFTGSAIDDAPQFILSNETDEFIIDWLNSATLWRFTSGEDMQWFPGFGSGTMFLKGTFVVDGNIISNVDLTDNLGSSSIAWNNLFVGTILQEGATSGTLTFAVPAAITSHTLTWPSAQGEATTNLQNDGSGGLSWVAAPATGATIELDNLGTVAINTSLISDTDITDDLGTGDIRWNNIFSATLRSGLTAADTLLLQARDVDGASWTTFATLTSNNTPTMSLASAVTAVTQSGSDNSTKLATTAYADAAGAVATDVIWDAKGDLAGGTGADTAVRLAVGTNDQVLTAASGETTGMKWADAAGGGGGATTALDNLASVAINTSLISDTDSTDDLGSSSIFWAETFTDKISLTTDVTVTGVLNIGIIFRLAHATIPLSSVYEFQNRDATSSGQDVKLKYGSISGTADWIFERRSSNITFVGGSTINFKANNGFIFNSASGTNGDVIIKGLNDANLFRSDASTDRVGIGIVAPLAKLHIDQSSSTGAAPVLKLDQADIDDTFVDFIGTSAADGSRSISSDTTEDSTKFGAIRIEINGVTKWVRVYDDES